ncbi:NAD-dependent epimerase/dehydratase family protein [Clostridium tyrobutyricum]|uniref:NAD-dependent epimerase/dehydratase family protein n=1 Tax=Clostridium tyrobutyricum TaxID=1519 RepID=UPI0011C99DC0|nr:NAD-dependent epimerase/dehydratase family protein [Clostridium tyrobutyricum]
MRVLILGGTGAMGIHLSRILEERGDNVHVTSRKQRTSTGKINYIIGNAHDLQFISKIIKYDYDAVIDFMVYSEQELRDRIELILASTKQYIFLSSSRVYANLKKPLTEDSARLLDVCDDEEYLATQEYALEKARQENILMSANTKNWTIIRPYITYSNQRLQLGVYEKEVWLNRALCGRTIIFPKDIAEKLTTLTYGADVAKVIMRLLGNQNAFGQIVHVTGFTSMTWKEVLNIYLDTIEKVTQHRPQVIMPGDSKEIANVMRNEYQVKYDRLFNRVFDNSKADKLCNEKIMYVDMREGLERCLREYINSKPVGGLSPRIEAYFNRITGERTSSSEFASSKAYIKYLLFRYTPLIKMKRSKSN